MKFSVGYQVMDGIGDYFSDIVQDYREHIREVYFAWPGIASGREPVDEAHAGQMQDELRRIKDMGVGLNLLFNASCYGSAAATQGFVTRTVELVSMVRHSIGLDGITTMSPVIARAVRERFPELDVRASVNMKLGSVRAYRYAADLFTSFYVQREYNRDPSQLKTLGDWAAANGKKLYVLVNSGCLHACPAQTFHDNLVAHGCDSGFVHLCRERYADPANRADFLKGTWIRPEDIGKHAVLFSGGYKLATRRHSNPRKVIDAYARGRFFGNLAELTEPGFSPHFEPDVIDNSRFPVDWFRRSCGCGQDCGACGYCEVVLQSVLRGPEQVSDDLLQRSERTGIQMK